MKLGKKTIVLLGVPLGLGLAGGLAAFVMLSGGSGEAAKTPPPDHGAGEHGIMLALEQKVVNLMDGGDYRYAKVGVTLELLPESASFYALKGEERHAAEELAHKSHEAAVPMLLDALGRVVAGKTSTELSTPEGRQGLKEELLGEMRHVMGEEEVLDLYFTDMVMQ